MQYVALAVVLALIIGLTYTATHWSGGLHMTFSQHAATNRWSKIFYSLLFTVTLPVFLWFITGWLVPEKHLLDTFVWFTTIAVIFQIACTWVPETGDIKTAVHRTLTGISCVAMLPLVVMLATSSNLPISARITAWIALVIMAVLLLLLVLKNQIGQRWALLLQVGYYAAFFGAILVTTYL